MPLIGSYLPPSTSDHIIDLEEALNRLLGRDPVVLGGLNADIGHLSNPRNQQFSDFLASFGSVELLRHFRQFLRYCHLQTWGKVCQVRILKSRCD